MGYSSWGHKESDMSERAHTHTHTHMHAHTHTVNSATEIIFIFITLEIFFKVAAENVH